MNQHLKQYFIYVLLVTVSLSLPLIAQEKSKLEPKTKLSKEARVDELFKDYNMDTPGAAVAIVKDGIVIYRKGFGSAHLEYNIPITPSTIFHVASVSKQFTCMAITLLEAQGKLSADDDIRNHLPWVPDFGKTITIRHLMNNVSGIRDQWGLLIMAGWRLDDVITQKHVINLVKRQKELNFDPGHRYLYSNTGFTLLTEIVTRVSGMPFEQFCHNNIFRPLGMTSTHFHNKVEMIVKNRAYSYGRNEKKVFVKRLLSYATVGATSLFTTVEDLANWMRNFSENRLTDTSTMKKLFEVGILNNGKKINYARGIIVRKYKGLQTYSHSGGDAGFRSFVVYFPELKFGVTVLSNYASSAPARAAYKIADIYLKDQFKEEKQTAEPKTKKEKIIKMSAKKLKAFEGTYWLNDLKLLRKLMVEKGKLFYVRSATNRTQLLPISDTSFMMAGLDDKVIVAFSDKRNKKFHTYSVIEGQDPPPIGKRIKFSPPTAQQLNVFTGKYYSQELDFYYNIVLENEKLYVRCRNSDSEPLKPLPEDNFTYSDGYIKIQFKKDDNGLVTGFLASTGRVLNLSFKKIN